MEIKVTHVPSKEGWTEKYRVTPDLPELRCATYAIARMSSLDRLAQFAVARHGYGTDGGGVTYPSDVDDYDRASGNSIPEGFVEVYGYVGDAEKYQIRECDYLEILKQILIYHRKSEMAGTVAVLKAKLQSGETDLLLQ